MIKKILFLISAVLIWEGCKHAITSQVLIAENDEKLEFKVHKVSQRGMSAGSPIMDELESSINNSTCKKDSVVIIAKEDGMQKVITWGCFQPKI